MSRPKGITVAGLEEALTYLKFHDFKGRKENILNQVKDYLNIKYKGSTLTWDFEGGNLQIEGSDADKVSIICELRSFGLIK